MAAQHRHVRWLYPGLFVGTAIVICVIAACWGWVENRRYNQELQMVRQCVIDRHLKNGAAALAALHEGLPPSRTPVRFGASGSVSIVDARGGLWGEMPGTPDQPRLPVSQAFGRQVREWYTQLADGTSRVRVQHASPPVSGVGPVHLLIQSLDGEGTLAVAAVAEWEVAAELAPLTRVLRQHKTRSLLGLGLLVGLLLTAAIGATNRMSRKLSGEVTVFTQALASALSRGEPIKELSRSMELLEPLVQQVNGLVGELNAALSRLRDSEQRYRRLFHGNAMGIWVLDARELMARFGALRSEGITDLAALLDKQPDLMRQLVAGIRVVDANREAVVMYGARSRAHLMKSFRKVIGDSTAAPFREMMACLYRGDSRVQVLGAGHRLDGAQLDVLYTLFRLERRERGLLAMNTLDVTTRMRAMRELAAETEQLQTLLASMADGVIVTDRKGRIVRINEAACRLTGFDVSQAIGYPISQVVRTTQVRTDEPENDGVRPFLKKQSQAFAGMMVLHGRDGSRRFVEESRSPLVSTDGRFDGMVFVLRDVTEQQRVREELNRVRNLESLGVLAGGIAHEFNNLMTGLFGRISLARIHAGEGSRVSRELGEAERLMDRARGLTARLLTFSKGGQPVRSQVGLALLVSQAAAMTEENGAFQLDTDIPDDLPDVKVDEAQTVQLFSCLFQNAVEACGKACRVSVSARMRMIREPAPGLDPGAYVEVMVTDNGPGFPEAYLDQVFDPYFSTREMGQGLGLSIVYGIVKRHGGHVTADNAPGGGARITLYLPMVT